MKIDVVTLFPEQFAPDNFVGLVRKALDGGVASVDTIDPRKFTNDVHRTVDDTPYGGGAGMVMKCEPVVAAIREAKAKGEGPVVMLTPQGRPLTNDHLWRWAKNGRLTLVAGRYEGFDDRIRGYVDEEISIGDYVLTGGEPAALVIIDGVIRLLPGVVGGGLDTTLYDSFAEGLLEHPHYTRPVAFDGAEVPDVLRSGDHKRIEAWRRARAVERTHERRPDLLASVHLADEDRAVLDAVAGPKTSIAVPDHADLAPLAAIVAAWGLDRVYVVGPDAGARVAALDDFEAPMRDLRPKRKRRGPRPTRAVPASVFEPVADWGALAGVCELPRYGCAAFTPATASVPDGPVCLCFGDGADGGDLAGWLPPIRQGSLSNELPLIVAVSATLERLRGEG